MRETKTIIQVIHYIEIFFLINWDSLNVLTGSYL